MSTLCAHLAAFGARPPGPGDAPFLAALYASTRPDLLGAGTADPALVAASMAMHQRMQAASFLARFPHAAVLLLESAGQSCARIVVDSDCQRVRLVDLAVLPAWRKAGLGGAIVRALQDWANGQGLPLHLAVQPGNGPARRLYLAAGFIDTGADREAPGATGMAWSGPGPTASFG